MGLLGPISLMYPLRLRAFPTQAPSLHPFECPHPQKCARVLGGHIRLTAVRECSRLGGACVLLMVGGLCSTPL